MGVNIAGLGEQLYRPLIKFKTAGDLSVAISQAIAHQGGPVLIECPLTRDDCSKQLAEWGSHVAKANARV